MFLKLKKYLQKHSTAVTIFGFILLAIAGAVFFFYRYPFAYTESNFFAEDGRYFIKNLLEKGFFEATFTVFNGYLIVAQYLIGQMALIVNAIFGDGFATLAKAVSVVSYVFFGLVCALPFLLFRKKLGTPLALITVLLLWITPFGTYDYFVLGTIGNLKFVFIFIAALLIIYRNSKDLCVRLWQFVLIDTVLLLCVLTNIITVGLLPLILIRYWKELKVLFLKKKIRQLFTPDFISVIALAFLSFVYLLVVYLSGVPTIEGYFDGPLKESSLVALIYSATIHGLLFPITYLFNNIYATITVFLAGLYIFWKKENRDVALVVVVAIALSVFGFVFNRPGVTEVYLSFNQGIWTSNFFYAGTMLTVFAVCYSSRNLLRNSKLLTRWVVVGSVLLFIFLTIPAAGFNRMNPYAATQAQRPTLVEEVNRVCLQEAISDSEMVTIEVYPWQGWTMDLQKNKICK